MPHRSMAPWLAGAFLLLLALHLAIAFHLPGPILYEDTMGYLAIARDLTGWRPQPVLHAPSGFYHVGYPLLLAPLYLVLGSTWRVFQGALVLDSLLASLQVVVLWLLGRGLLGLGRGFALGAALAAALYPAWLLQSSFGWTESLFAFLFSLWVLLAWEALRRGSGGGPWLLAFACTGGFLYAVHPRGLGLVAVTGAALALWGAREVMSRSWSAAGLAGLAALFLATREINQEVFARLWLSAPLSREGTVLGRLLDPAVWTGPLAARAAGQVWYLLAATLGLFAVGVIVLARRAVSRQRPEPLDPARARVSALLLAAAAAVLAASATIMLPAERPDHLVYGRYNEALLGPFLLAGLAGLAGPRRQRLARLAGAAALLALLGLLLPRVLPAEILAGQPMPLNVLGVLLWNRWAALDLGATTARALAALAALALVALASRRAAVAALALFFTLSAVSVERQLLPWCRAVRAAVTMQDAIRPLHPEAVSYERSALNGTYGFNGYQFWLDHVPFHLFDAAAGERPRNDLVIASKNWGGRAPGFRLLAAEPAGVDLALWVGPGPRQEELERRGWLVPLDPAEPLPAAACRSRLERIDGGGTLEMRAGEDVVLRFRLRHAGSGRIWIPLGTVESPWGSVRLGAQWYSAGGTGSTAALAAQPLRAELPRIFRPGDTAEIDLRVSARAPDGRPLEPGSYVLEVGLVQEGVQWFAAAGDPPLRIPVTLTSGETLTSDETLTR